MLKMAKNGPLEAEMGPKEAKTAQKNPNWSKMTPNVGKRFPYARPPYHHVFGTPNPGWRRSAATKLLKMANNGPKQSQRGPNAPKMAPNLGHIFSRNVAADQHHPGVGGPNTW